MTNEEVNEIIVDFMGWEFDYHKIGAMLVEDGEICDYSDLYTESLDALVPVWERLKVRDLKFLFNNYAKNKCFIGLEVVEGSSISSSSEDSKLNIQEAAAHATAKVISELK